MAKIDDYKYALELAKDNIKNKAPELLALECGGEFISGADKQGILQLTFLNRHVSISWPDLNFSFKNSEQEVGLQHQVFLLHYLNNSQGRRAGNTWIAYQEIPDGKFYLDAFLRRAKNPLVQTFGTNPALFVKLATDIYGAIPFDQGDYSVIIRPLSNIPVAMILWEGDDEFPPEGNIIFDKTISEILSAEDIAWLCGTIVYPLVGMAYAGKS